MNGVLRVSATAPSAPIAIRPAPGPTSSSTRRAASLERHAVADQVGQALGRELHQDALADARHRDSRARRAVGAGADDRRVADAAGVTLAGAAGRRGGREPAGGVERDGADRPEPRVLALPGLRHRGVIEPAARLVEVALPVGDLVGRRHDADLLAQAHGERQRLGAGEHHVGVLLEQVAREAHGVAQQRNLRDGSGPAVARHHARVEPRDAVRLQVRARAGVEQRLVLERAYRGLDRVERAAVVERAPARVGRALTSLLPGLLLTGG